MCINIRWYHFKLSLITLNIYLNWVNNYIGTLKYILDGEGWVK